MRITELRTLTLALLLSSCTGSTEPRPEAEEDPFADAPYEVVACGDMAPAATGALPTEHVAVGQLPASFSPPLLALVETDDPAVSGYAGIFVDAGDATLVAPVHPSGSADGGAVSVWITDGTRACAPFDFTVEALTPSPGLLAEIVMHLQAIADAQAASLEVTRDDLIDTPLDQQPTPLIPLAVFQGLLDHPDNENSLSALAAGTAPVAADARLDLLEPLLAMTGIEAALADIAPAPGSGAPAAVPARVSAAQCEPATIGDDASLLDACMDAAAEATFELSGASGDVLREMAEFFTGMGMVPGLGTPAAIAGFITWMILNDKLRTAALLPSILTGMTVDVDPLEFAEDEEATGSWSNAQVTATNVGWDFGKEFLEGLLQAASVAGVFDKTELPGNVDETLLAIATGPGVAALIGDGTLESFRIPPEPFGPVDVSASDWSEAQIALGTAVALLDHTDYEPREHGTATLSVRTATGEFSGQQQSYQETITVGMLQVTIAPDDVFLGPGESEEFTVTVIDSEHPEMVEIENPEDLQGSASISYDGDGKHTVSYTAPATPDADDPDLLTVRHTAETGARGFSEEERNSIAQINFGGIRITTMPGCIELGDDPIQFEAEVPGDADPELVWSASAGDIGETTGLFEPPDESGFVTITVALADNPTIDDSIEVPIGGCSCRGTLTVGGESAPTASLYFFLSGDLTDVFSVQWRAPDLDGTAAFHFGTGVDDQHVIPFGTTGESDAFGSGRVYESNFVNPSTFADLEVAPLTASISTNTGSVFAGVISGEVILLDPTDPHPVQLTFEFYIEEDPTIGYADDVKWCRVE